MSFRELTMTDVREVLRRYQAGQSARQLAREEVADRKTAGRYFEAARACEVGPQTELTDEVVARVARQVQGRRQPEPSEAWAQLMPHKERIEAWLAQELTLVRIHELLVREGVDASYNTLRRWAQKQLGHGGPRVTVRVQDSAPGEEAQVDFGHVGWLEDEKGQKKKLWALLVTLSFSRYLYVWPTLTQTVRDVCEGLDAAWRFFGGVPLRLVLDNASSMVTVPNAQAPVLQRSFLEYAQARGLFVDPARVRRPQDKGKVENAVPYVRERWCAGERFYSLDDARRSAQAWCHDVAGARVHGTTRLIPRDVFEAEEKPMLKPAPTTSFDVPTWSTAKVHPDHHVQVARALYSVPTAYIGRVLDVRSDSKSVRLYSGATLVKSHPRVAAGQRSTDANDYPRTKAAYALRDVEALKAQATGHGPSVGRYAEALLAGPLPWTRMRQVYGLLRLCERYTPARVDALCARALAFDVLDVPRIERMLKAARQVEDEACATGKVLPLPGRFARDASHFATRAAANEGGAE
ncbi:IS21 family transposase [Myxococcus sp. RHSTA-1-4]|uniref:IS21 family transposase n=1 Tax=Myxococcus sp. RHSTA-1-4 TaxID=2874601 RepID=UPI001CBEAF4C|nr:IS21 family transposase [Myxococcus sp. RHSTA-1-4]MBZ4423240.1 IS21 family transposase [Myxococcus sp. RHSTA-1-4]